MNGEEPGLPVWLWYPSCTQWEKSANGLPGGCLRYQGVLGIFWFFSQNIYGNFFLYLHRKSFLSQNTSLENFVLFPSIRKHSEGRYYVWLTSTVFR